MRDERSSCLSGFLASGLATWRTRLSRAEPSKQADGEAAVVTEQPAESMPAQASGPVLEAEVVQAAEAPTAHALEPIRLLTYCLAAGSLTLCIPYCEVAPSDGTGSAREVGLCFSTQQAKAGSIMNKIATQFGDD